MQNVEQLSFEHPLKFKITNSNQNRISCLPKLKKHMNVSTIHRWARQLGSLNCSHNPFLGSTTITDGSAEFMSFKSGCVSSSVIIKNCYFTISSYHKNISKNSC